MQGDMSAADIDVSEVWNEAWSEIADGMKGRAYVHGAKAQRAKLRCVIGMGFGKEVDPESNQLQPPFSE